MIRILTSVLGLAVFAAADLANAASAQDQAPPASLNAYPAERLLPFWRTYVAQTHDGEPAFRPAYRLDPPPAPDEAVSGFWLEGPDGTLLPLEVDTEGYLIIPQAARAAGFVTRASRMLHDAQRPLPAIRLEIVAELPPARHYPISDLAAITHAVDHFQRDAMGLAALMAPRFDTLVWHFDGPAPDGWLTSRNGQRQPIEAYDNTLSLRMTGRIGRQGGQVELEALPLRLTIEVR